MSYNSLVIDDDIMMHKMCFQNRGHIALCNISHEPGMIIE